MATIWSALSILTARHPRGVQMPPRRVRPKPMRRAGVYEVAGQSPSFGEHVYVAAQAVVVGDVRLGERASVWFGAVVRGDNGLVDIGAGSNVQDLAVLHGLPGHSTSVGSLVTIGHGAGVHGCRIGDRCLIGMQALVMDDADIGADTIVGARALVTRGKRFPPGVLLMGSPATVVRDLTLDEVASIRRNGEEYVARAAVYGATLKGA